MTQRLIKYLLFLASIMMVISLGCSFSLPVLQKNECKSNLDEDELARLTLSMDKTLQMQPGESQTLYARVVECCYEFKPVNTCGTWSIEPSQGASIDAKTGLLKIDPSTPGGSHFVVTLDVENGRRVISTDLYIYTAAANPLIGYWQEESELTCNSSQAVIPKEPIAELVFKADNSFSVTWTPFEIYRDYWGKYTFDKDKGIIHFVIEDGNYIPGDFTGDGQFSIDSQGKLVLRDVWFGSPHSQTLSANCGHIFTR
jgi:hypothetical protein